jgi:hypothetical protein
VGEEEGVGEGCEEDEDGADVLTAGEDGELADGVLPPQAVTARPAAARDASSSGFMARSPLGMAVLSGIVEVMRG